MRVDVQGAYVQMWPIVPTCRQMGSIVPTLRPMRYHGFMSHAQVNLQL
eukprot:COSAG02_NODE_3412_length_6785_cov_30.460664_4_plen_48_part_00